MRRMLLAPALIVVLVVALPAVALAQTGPRTTGGGTWTNSFGQTVTGSVIMKAAWPPGGANPHVRITVTNPDSSLAYAYRGSIECYDQNAGNDLSRVSGPIYSKTSGTESVERDFFLWAVFDGKAPQGGGDLVRTRPTTVQQDCTTSTLAPDKPLTSGNFRIHSP